MLGAGCGTSGSADSSAPVRSPDGDTGRQVTARIADLDALVDRWAGADTLAEAHAGAEAARNLVTGPDVQGYGDADGDGQVAGTAAIGLLPGERGELGLIATPATECVERDVLGGSWADPRARWDEVRRRIAAWAPDNNTFPGLPSHPQRVVGWASLTLASTDLDQAKEYAGHAALHVRISQAAVGGC